MREQGREEREEELEEAPRLESSIERKKKRHLLRSRGRPR
jgi:hypothetical protein